MGIFDFFKGKKRKRNCPICGGEMEPFGSDVECYACSRKFKPVYFPDHSAKPCTPPPLPNPPSSPRNQSVEFVSAMGGLGFDPITDKQRQFLLDLGVRTIPNTKEEASELLDSLLGPIEQWLKFCFRKVHVLDRPLERSIQIALHRAQFRHKFPGRGDDLTDEQRLQVVQVVLDTVGSEVLKSMGPIRISLKDDKLTLKPSKPTTPRRIKFECNTCRKSYEVAEELSNTKLLCQGCNQEILVPRPKLGHYAAPTVNQLDKAQVYGVHVSEGTNRGELNQMLEEAMRLSSRPLHEVQDRIGQIEFGRELREVDQRIAAIQKRLKACDLTPEEGQHLESELESAKEEKHMLLEERREDEREQRKQDQLEKQWEKQVEQEELAIKKLAISVLESDFDPDDVWGRYYRKPTRKQFNAIYAWLATSRPDWSESIDSRSSQHIADAIDVLFPELKR